MTRPRSQLVCVDETPYYHITSRCVRRSFLCGYDSHSGNNYEHRRLFIEQRVHILSAIFAIDICAYAIMSNHYHIVLKLCPQQASTWHENEVCERWLQLFQGTLLVQQYQVGKALTPTQIDTVKATIAVWRDRLTNLGWFMKCLNEPIARMANQEDDCTGHFWESRYKSQCLKTEQALLSCMAYVELNPLRANLAATPESSEHTSIKERICPTLDLPTAVAQQIADGQLRSAPWHAKPFMPFFNGKHDDYNTLPWRWEDYLNLVDWTGRIIREDKRGAIHAELPPILTRLNINPKSWLKHTTAFEHYHPKVFNKEASYFATNSC